MSNHTTTWTLNFISDSITKGLGKVKSMVKSTTGLFSKLGDCIKRVNAIDLLAIDFFFQAEDGIRDTSVTGVQTCALPICYHRLSVLSKLHPPNTPRIRPHPDAA